MDCFACRKYFEVLQRCVWTQTTQDFSFYKFSFLCKGRRVLGSNATYPIILPWCAETIWNWRVKHARKKTPYPHTYIYIYISTIVLGMNGPTQTASLLQEASNSHTSTSISHFALSCASCSTLLHIAPPIVSEISLLFRSFQIYWASQKRFCMLLWQAICYIGYIWRASSREFHVTGALAEWCRLISISVPSLEAVSVACKNASVRAAHF